MDGFAIVKNAFYSLIRHLLHAERIAFARRKGSYWRRVSRMRTIHSSLFLSHRVFFRLSAGLFRSGPGMSNSFKVIT